MPGYHLVERGTHESADAAARDKLGLLDLLRELAADDPAIPKLWRVEVTGLEQVLFAAGRQSAGTLARKVHGRLNAAASVLDRQLADVRVIFEGRLQRGDEMWSEYRGERLPVSHIFGSPPPLTSADGRKTYFVNFHLSV